jgi:hypothetical protein
MTVPLCFDKEPSQLPDDPKERHEQLVDFFGRFLFWIRNNSIRTAHKFVESEELRAKLGTVRSAPYDEAAKMDTATCETAFLLAQEVLDGFIERLIWSLGDEGTDARFGALHAYRFRVEMEIVDVASGEVKAVETINRGGRFFGSYWGRWLNRFKNV